MGIQTSGCEIIGILKKLKDTDGADSHHALEWKERQKSRVERLRSRLLLWRSSPQSMREDLENIYMLLYGFQLAPCSVGWVATQKSIVLVPDPIVFAPWSVLVDRGEPCDSRHDTPHETTLPGTGTRNRQERRVPANHHRRDSACSVLPHRAAAGVNVDFFPRCGVVFPSCPMPHHKSVGKVTLATIKLRSDDDGSRKQGVPNGQLVRHISQDSLFSSCLFLNLSDGEASFRALDDNGDGADCVSSFDETVQMLSHAGVDGHLSEA